MSGETANYKLVKPKKGQLGWDTSMNNNLDAINNQHNQTQTLVDNNSSLISSFTVQPRYFGYNMGFDVAQRGTSITSTTDEYTLDMWKKTGVNATISQLAGTAIPTGEFNSDYCMKVSLDAAGLCTLSNEIPFPVAYSDLYRYVRGKTVTFACDVYTSVASLASISIFDGVDDTVAGTSTHTGGGSVERLVVTKTISNVATELTVRLKVNGSSGNTAYFANAAFAIGNFSTLDYFTTNPMDDWMACMSMYQSHSSINLQWAPVPGFTSGTVTMQRRYTLELAVPMLTVPSITLTNSGTDVNDAATTAVNVEDESTVSVTITVANGQLNLEQGKTGIAFTLEIP